jgi:hypothetical protein
MWDGVAEVVSVIFFFGLMSVVGMLEGMQIAFFAVAKLTEEELNSSPWARWTCELLFANGGRGLPGFMIGRQLCVVSCFFIIARVTTLELDEGDSNVMGFGDGAQKFFETGLLGAFITTIVASIAWQLVASAFPLMFMGNPATYVLLRLCLFLEATGIASGAWVLASVHKKIAHFQKDEVYIGSAEERAAMGHGDHVGHTTEIGHLTGGAYPAGHQLPFEDYEDRSAGFSARRQTVLKNIEMLREQLKESTTKAEREAFERALSLEVACLEKVNKQQQKLDHFHAEKGTEAGEEDASEKV